MFVYDLTVNLELEILLVRMKGVLENWSMP